VLAQADMDDVLKAWEGLGYYRRARNLHAAARVVRERFGGKVPGRYQDLRTLPGVGEYTAGAVASIAFDEPVPAVDGNVRRVLSRIFDVPDPKPTWLRRVAASLLDSERPGDWNQALMELGATVCKPLGPLCEECPVADFCAARAAGTQADRPRKREKSAVREARFALGVFWHGPRVMLVQRPIDGLLGGLWAFPEAEIVDGDGRDALGDLVTGLGLAGLGEPEPLPTVEHRFTHLFATYLPWCLPVESASQSRGVEWLDLDEPPEIAIPVAQQKVLRSFQARA
jgi:A/G-specific adenine glycosylase